MSDLNTYRATTDARNLIADGVRWDVAVRSAAVTHCADPVTVAWLVAHALAARKAAWARLQHEDDRGS